MTTLPESLIETIKALTRAHEAFAREVEELTALSLTIRESIDRLVARQHSLASVDPTDKRPIPLPRAIMPKDADGAA